MKTVKIPLLAALLSGLPVGSIEIVRADDMDGHKSGVKSKAKEAEAPRDDSRSEKTEADNTRVNKRDRNEAAPTADDSKNNKTDIKLSAQIRRSLMKDKSLSSDARNVKVIAQEGTVTLKGPVLSEEEKATVEQRATEIAGASKVKSELEVKP